METTKLQKKRCEGMCDCARGGPINREQAVGYPLSFSIQWPDKACLSWLSSICEALMASPGLLHRAGVGAIHHCQEMCCTQQGCPSSLLFLQQELQILKRCRTCTLEITIHHRGSLSQGEATLHMGLTQSQCGSRLPFLPGTWNRKPLRGSVQTLENPHTPNLLRFGGKWSLRQ